MINNLDPGPERIRDMGAAALALIGIGRASVRRVALDGLLRMDVGAASGRSRSG